MSAILKTIRGVATVCYNDDEAKRLNLQEFLIVWRNSQKPLLSGSTHIFTRTVLCWTI